MVPPRGVPPRGRVHGRMAALALPPSLTAAACSGKEQPTLYIYEGAALRRMSGEAGQRGGGVARPAAGARSKRAAAPPSPSSSGSSAASVLAPPLLLPPPLLALPLAPLLPVLAATGLPPVIPSAPSVPCLPLGGGGTGAGTPDFFECFDR